MIPVIVCRLHLWYTFMKSHSIICHFSPFPSSKKTNTERIQSFKRNIRSVKCYNTIPRHAPIYTTNPSTTTKPPCTNPTAIFSNHIRIPRFTTASPNKIPCHGPPFDGTRVGHRCVRMKRINLNVNRACVDCSVSNRRISVFGSFYHSDFIDS